VGAGDTVVIVGPNNSGKTAALRGIQNIFGNAAAGSNTPVVRALEFRQLGDANDLEAWLRENTVIRKGGVGSPEHAYKSGGTISVPEAREIWERRPNNFPSLVTYFSVLIATESRLQAGNPVNSLNFATDPPQLPAQYLQRYDDEELKISAAVRKAFNQDLIVHRGGGPLVILYVGERPELRANEDRASLSYNLRLESLPRLQEQGDGIRSFVGCLLQATVPNNFVVLMDEPEAFLHPPQAEFLGRILMARKSQDSQLIVATHSSDFLKGLLASGANNIRILRLTRHGDTGSVATLVPADIRAVWSDPLLRHSNILDGLFHRGVVVCESDADCRFYAAVHGELEHVRPSPIPPDLMFVSAGGKDRMHIPVEALRALKVPLKAVIDFDALRNPVSLSTLVTAIGGKWKTYEADHGRFVAVVDAMPNAVRTEEIRTQVNHAIDRIESATLTDRDVVKIKRAVTPNTAWIQVKENGLGAIPAGEGRDAAMRLVAGLREVGIHVVLAGELESFHRSSVGHGPRWVTNVLTSVPLNSPELRAAREFVGEVVTFS
jgi:predicted ATPase